MKKQKQVESYIPAAAFYEGKREAAGKLFRDRFAIVDLNADFSVLAFRGENLNARESLAVDRKSIPSLRLLLAGGERVLVALPEGAALFFGDWIWKGLVPVLLLRDSYDDLRAAADILRRFEIAFIEKDEPETGKRELSEVCRRFSESLNACDRVFDPKGAEAFRSHAARIAEFAGCRAGFSDLPFDSFALFLPDVRKWTLLLLCLFLSLRGVGGDEPTVSLRKTGETTILPGVDFAPLQEKKQKQPLFLSFLQHPAFSDVIAEQTPDGVRFSVTLSRKPKAGELCAVSQIVRFFFLLETA